MKIFAALLLLGCIFIFVYKRIIRKQFFKDRKPTSLEDIYNTYVKDHKIKYETFAEVYKLLGDSYSVDPRLIRPTDPLKKFFDIDSWDLDVGTEKMNDWLTKTLKIETPPKKEIKTVLDLLIFVETGK